MDDATRRALAEVNRGFYSRYAQQFSATRSRPRSGWRRIAETLAAAAVGVQRPRVLDVGCGNGVFARFLADAMGRSVEYVGLDASAELLEIAASALGTDARLLRHDFVSAPSDAILPSDAGADFELVAVLNVLHHVPGFDRRRALLEAASHRTARGGLLAVTFWQFGERARFAGRMIPWDAAPEPIDASRLEPGDHLVRWGDDAVRFCHFADADEVDALVDLRSMTVVDRYDDDGRSGDLNRYVLLLRQRD